MQFDYVSRMSEHAPKSSVRASRPAPVAARPLLHAAGVERLRAMIVRGELAPGEKLNERVLAARLGISRTPLREAIRSLASEGLAQLLPHRGACVAPIDAARVREVFVVLASLESLAGELACRHATDLQRAELRAAHYAMLLHHARGELAQYFECNQRIHALLVEASGNAVLLHAWRSLNAQVQRVRFMANRAQGRWDQAIDEHEALLAAFEAGDGPRLAVLLRAHLEHTGARVLGAVENPANSVEVADDARPPDARQRDRHRYPRRTRASAGGSSTPEVRA